MQTVKKLLEEVNRLRAKRFETNVALYQGEQGFESHLIVRSGEIEYLTEEMYNYLAKYALSLGFGDEHNKIVLILQKYNNFLKKSIEAAKTGQYWEDIKIK